MLKPEKAAPLVVVFVDHHDNEHDYVRGDDEAQHHGYGDYDGEDNQ